MADRTLTREINAKEALKCIRGPMSNAEVMARFKITASGYADLLRQLYEHNLITEEDLRRRGIAYKSIKKKKDLPPPPQQEVAQAAPPDQPADEGFLDTVALTQMLSADPAKELDDTEEAKPAEQPKERSGGKKGKFRIKGMFKKKS